MAALQQRSRDPDGGNVNELNFGEGECATQNRPLLRCRVVSAAHQCAPPPGFHFGAQSLALSPTDFDPDKHTTDDLIFLTNQEVAVTLQHVKEEREKDHRQLPT